MTETNFLILIPGETYISDVGSSIKIISVNKTENTVEFKRMDTGFTSCIHYSVMMPLTLKKFAVIREVIIPFRGIRNLGKPRGKS